MALTIVSKSSTPGDAGADAAPAAGDAAATAAKTEPAARATDDAGAGEDEGQGAAAARGTETDVNIDPKTLSRLTNLSKAERTAREKAKTLETELTGLKAKMAELEALRPKAEKLDRVSKLADEDPIQAFRELDKDLDTAMAKFIATPAKSDAEKAAAAAVAAVQAKQAELEAKLAEKEKGEVDAKTKAEQDAAAAASAAKLEGVHKYIGDRLVANADRWDVTAREATADKTIVPGILEAVMKTAIDRRRELRRDLTEDEGNEVLDEALDAAEEHFVELGARYQRSNPRTVRTSARRGLQMETLEPAETERHPPTIDGSLRGPLRGNAAPKRAMSAQEARAKALAKYGGRR